MPKTVEQIKNTSSIWQPLVQKLLKQMKPARDTMPKPAARKVTETFVGLLDLLNDKIEEGQPSLANIGAFMLEKADGDKYVYEYFAQNMEPGEFYTLLADINEHLDGKMDMDAIGKIAPWDKALHDEAKQKEQAVKEQHVALSGVLHTYSFNNKALRNSFLGEKYASEEYNSPSISLGRSGGFTATVLYLFSQKDKNGSRIYTADDMFNPKKFADKKQEEFDLIAQHAEKSGSTLHKIPELDNPDSKWLVEHLHTGIKAGVEVIDELAEKVDFNNPDYMKSKEFIQMCAIASSIHDAWQEICRFPELMDEKLKLDYPDLKTPKERYDAFSSMDGPLGTIMADMTISNNEKVKLINNDIPQYLRIFKYDLALKGADNIFKGWKQNGKGKKLSEYFNEHNSGEQYGLIRYHADQASDIMYTRMQSSELMKPMTDKRILDGSLYQKITFKPGATKDKGAGFKNLPLPNAQTGDYTFDIAQAIKKLKIKRPVKKRPPVQVEIVTNEQLNSMFSTAVRSQKTMEDEIWNCLNMGVMSKFSSDTISMGDADKEQLKYVLSKNQDNLIKKIDNNYRKHTLTKYFDKPSLTELTESLITLGAIKSKLYHDIGEEYVKNRKKFRQNDPQRDDKAMYLTQKSIGDAMLRVDAFSTFQNQLIDLYAEKLTPEFVGLDIETAKNMTVGQFLDSNHMHVDDMDKFLENEKRFDPDIELGTNLFEHYKKRTMSELKLNDPAAVKDEDVMKNIMSEKFRLYVDQNILRGVEMAKYAPRIGKNAQKNVIIGEKLTSGYEAPDSIKKWIEDEADPMLAEDKPRNYCDTFDKISWTLNSEEAHNIRKKHPVDTTYKSVDIGDDEFNAYINEHMGRKILNESPEEQQIHLAKAMSAHALCRSGQDFSEKQINYLAEEMLNRPAFRQITITNVMRSLYDVDKLKKCTIHVFDKTFGVAKNRQQDYINNMKILIKNMMSSENRSTEYQNLCNAVANIASLTPDSKELVVANQTLITAIKNYTKGKKRARRTEDGRARFDNALDALAIVKEFIPGSEHTVREQVDRIREVRNVRPGHKYYVDLASHGATRAANAAQEREQTAKEKKTKHKKQTKQQIKTDPGIKK